MTVLTQACPNCRTPYDPDLGSFCENCGYNLLPKEAPSPPKHQDSSPSSSPSASKHATLSNHWEIEITIDLNLWDTNLSPQPPERSAQVHLLTQAQTLIGRTNERRALYPDLSLDHDDAISHRHALLSTQPDGQLQLRDLGSSNGTFLKGTPVSPMTDVVLNSGDSFTLGHWTRITVHSR